MLINLQTLVSDAIVVDATGNVIGTIDRIEIAEHVFLVLDDDAAADGPPDDEDEVDPVLAKRIMSVVGDAS